MYKLFTSIFILLFFYSSEVVGQTTLLQIKSIDSTNNPIIEDLGYSKYFKSYDSIKAEINLFQKRLYYEGYINNKLIQLKKTNDTLFNAIFQLNNKFKELHVKYDSTQIKPSIINEIIKKKKNTIIIIPFNKTESILNLINKKLSEEGFPFTKIKLSEIKIKSKESLSATLVITKDKNQRSLDKIIIKDYEKFSKSFLKHYSKIKPEKLFNIASINKKLRTINSLKFARQVKPPEVLFTKDSTILYLFVKKQQSNSFDGFLGFNTNEDNNKLEFNGYLNLSLSNNFNFGESLELIYKTDENDQTTFNTTINTPYILGSPVGTEFGLNLFKKDTTFSTVNQKAKLYYQVNSNIQIFTGIDFSESTNLLSTDNNQKIQDYKSNFYSISFNFEKRNNAYSLFPIQSNFRLETAYGSRLEPLLTEKQTKLTTELFHIFNLNEQNSIYGKLNGKWLISNTFLENELFRFGGINSIRGFEENSLTANLLFILNTEYRYKLNSNIYLHSIVDLGYFNNPVIKQQENIYSLGFGFGLITNSGLLKFNFANGKTQNQQFKLTDSKIHLSLTALF